MSKFFILLLLVIQVVSCKTKQETREGSADQNFQTLSDQFLQEWFEWRPAMAVGLGLHEYDGKMTDFSKSSLDKQLKQLRDFELKLNAVDTTALSQKVFLDYRIVYAAIQSEIFDFVDMESYTKNPMSYAGAVDLNLYIKRNYAPLETRLKHIIAIENQIPAMFEAGKKNLVDSLPKPYIETAIEISKGSVDYLKGELAEAVKGVSDDSLKANFKASNEKAINAINDFVAWLSREKLPRAINQYAIGRDNYQKMLLYSEEIDITPEKILEIGLAELNREQEIFNSAARTINPSKKPIDVYREMQKEHPIADSLIPEARKHLEAIRQFLIDKNIVSIPSEARVKVEETPQYARSTSTASMDAPGPFEKNAQEAYYYITPVEHKWTNKQKEDWLGQFDYYTTDNITIHEAYPGHYLQGLHLNASSATKIEKIFGSYAFVEGWAHYCEKMMIDEGYGNEGDPIKAAKYRLAQSGDALLRICRLCVSIKMHCQGMSIEDGTKFFMENWHQGEKPSYQEALRGSFDPGYLFYTVGKLQILKLREDYKKQEGSNYSLKKFNDLVLDNGMPSIRLLRELLLKDKSKWDETLQE